MANYNQTLVIFLTAILLTPSQSQCLEYLGYLSPAYIAVKIVAAQAAPPVVAGVVKSATTAAVTSVAAQSPQIATFVGMITGAGAAAVFGGAVVGGGGAYLAYKLMNSKVESIIRGPEDALKSAQARIELHKIEAKEDLQKCLLKNAKAYENDCSDEICGPQMQNYTVRAGADATQEMLNTLRTKHK